MKPEHDHLRSRDSPQQHQQQHQFNLFISPMLLWEEALRSNFCSLTLAKIALLPLYNTKQCSEYLVCVMSGLENLPTMTCAKKTQPVILDCHISKRTDWYHLDMNPFLVSYRTLLRSYVYYNCLKYVIYHTGDWKTCLGCCNRYILGYKTFNQLKHLVR